MCCFDESAWAQLPESERSKIMDETVLWADLVLSLKSLITKIPRRRRLIND
jgi:hypothetical protein